MNEIDILVRTCIIFTVLAQALRQNFYSTLSTKDFLTIFSGTRGDKIVLETVTSMRWYSRISPQTTDEKGPKKQFHGDTRNWSTEKRGMNSDTEVEFLEEIQTEVLRVFLLAIHRHLILTNCTPLLQFSWT